jgi:hypothetical protein
MRSAIDKTGATARLVSGIVSLLFVFLAQIAWAETSPRYYAVEASARVQSSPPKITLEWPADERATSYRVYRKPLGASSWTPLGSLQGNGTVYTDTAVSAGSAFEYQIEKSTSYGYKGYVYLFGGIEAPMIENRGKVVLIVENKYAADLASELFRLQQDLAGDGWVVLRHDVARSDTPVNVKKLIKADYDADASNVKSVFLFGNVPVPYSGDFCPDNHVLDHQGAWPADAYYGDMDGTWTDQSVYSTSAERSRNHNVPGDGKFDQTNLPSEVELQVGRVDLSNMTCFANKTPSRSEKDLLRQYLNKDHNFRHRLIAVERRGLVCDNFGERNGEAFAASGWRNFAPFFGASKVSEVPGGSYFPTVASQSYLWSYGTGGGSFYTCNGIGSSDDFANIDVKTVFTMFLGSYFGDWDNESNFLRAPLGSTTYGLTASWSGRPHWYYHHMALGETIGFSTRLSQNNSGLYVAQNQGARQVHVALMGDPTLRMHPVVPPSGLSGSANSSGVTLNWGPSPDTNLRGYHVYRAASALGPFTRLNGAPISGTSYTDQGASGNSTYMVRAIKLEEAGSGTYLNPSQGVFFSVNGSGGNPPPPTPPAPPANLSAAAPLSSEVMLSWIDASSNETGFRVERKSGSAGVFQQIAVADANSVSYRDSNVVPGTFYGYRLRAINSLGDSPNSNESSVTTPAAVIPSGPTQVAFIKADNSTQGNWRGAYGTDGYQIMGNEVSYPAYAVVTSNGKAYYEWRDSTTDPRALQKAGASDRVAASWYSSSEFSVEVNFIDGKTHRLGIYCLDWDASGRSQTVDVLDSATGAVLNSQTLTAFSGGRYLVWDIRGQVSLRFKKVSGFNAVLMGLFFDQATTQFGGSNSGSGALSLGSANPLANGQFQLRITGELGQIFTIQASSDCKSWTPINTVTLLNPIQDFSDPNARQFPTRFYRAVPLIP